MKNIYLLLIISVYLVSCAGNHKKESKKDQNVITQADKDLLAKAQMFFKPLPLEALNPENPITKEKVVLGKMLYFDKRLSKNETQSCNTCHNLATYGVDNLASPGDNGIPGTRNSPTVLNASLKSAQFWDGRDKDVEEQAGGPILNPDEMAIPNEEFLIERLDNTPFYPALFTEAFPDDKMPLNYTNVRHAIAAFERTLLTPSAFDAYLANDLNAIDEHARAGLKIFIDSGCTACHMGNMMGGSMMQKFPLFGDYSDYLAGDIDYGKYQETYNEADKFMYFVPTLRNVEKTAPYLHSGELAELEETIYTMGKAELNRELTDEQVSDIVAFMKTLTGEVDLEWSEIPKGVH